MTSSHQPTRVIRALGIAYVLLLSASVATAGDTRVPDPLAGLQGFVDGLRRDLQVPGVAVVVVGLSEVPQYVTSGQLAVDDPTPVTPGTRFHIASVTKTFNATLAAALVSEGSLAWDTRVRDVIPEFELADPVASEHTTLRDLLAHRTGIGRNSLPSFNIDAEPEWWLSRLPLLMPEGEFRDRARYSGVMVGVSGIMIARRGGVPWCELVADRLLVPLGMESTTCGAPEQLDAVTAAGHVRFAGDVLRLDPVSLSVEVAQNGLYSTAEDLGRWIGFVLAGASVDGIAPIDSNVLAETWTPQAVVRTPGSSRIPEVRAYGLGWHVVARHGARRLSHGGGGVGYTAEIALLPDRGVGVAVLTNTALNPIPDMVTTRVLDRAIGFREPDNRDRAVEMVDRMDQMAQAARQAAVADRVDDAVPPRPLDGYVGAYLDRLYGRIEVRNEGGVLGVSFHDLGLEVVHLRDDVFVGWSPLFDSLRLEFGVDDDGTVDRLTIPIGPRGGEITFRRAENDQG